MIVIKKIKNNIKQMFIVSNALNDMKNNMRPQRLVVLNIRGNYFRVLHDNALIHSKGLFVAAAMRLLMKDGSTQDHMVVDDSFFKLSASSQLAVYFHEHAHFVCGHVDRMISSNFTFLQRASYAITGSIHPMELEADMYAVRHVGIPAMIQALYEISHQMGGIMPNEIKKRIQVLSYKED